MADMKNFYASLSTGRRASLLAGLVAILVLTGLLGWWVLRTPYGVLFSDMAERDAGSVVQELDRLKVPYRISADGRTVLVPQETVHKTRMALMGQPLTLQGAVGFELFNNSDFGASDFVQKVNYQRALQGELTRTILAIEQVQNVRVHLALPEQGLFRRETGKGKASVTVVSKAGQRLSPSQVVGIQRLVAASVPEVQAGDVTVLDQQGMALSRVPTDAEGSGASSVSLDASGDLESRLTAKVTQVLERMLGPGGAIATVDVVLSHQRSRVTTEEVLPASGQSKEQASAGVLLRERSTTRDAPAPGSAGEKGALTQSTTQELDYQNGKRVEEVVSPGGTVTRIHVAVVTRPSLSEADLARVRQLVSAAAGLQAARGDSVVVQSMLGLPAEAPHVPEGAVAGGGSSAIPAADSANPGQVISRWGTVALASLIALIAAALLLGRVLGIRSRRKAAFDATQSLSPTEREAVLRTVSNWLSPEPRS